MTNEARGVIREEEKDVIIAVDAYGAGGVEGVLYHGESRRGWEFCGIVEFVQIAEWLFQQMQYPREVLNSRSFFRKKQGNEETSEDAEADGYHDGRLATYLLRVSQRQNGSWQGRLKDLKTGKREYFQSFLELFEYLDAEHSALPDKNAWERIAWHNLPTVLCALSKSSEPEVERMVPNLFSYQLELAGKRNTFLMRTMFLEHHTCQGILYWKEMRSQKSFRSFLELIHLLCDAVKLGEDWVEDEMEMSLEA